MIRKLQRFMRDSWIPVAMYGGLFLFLGGLLFWQLGSLLPGYATQEAASLHASTSLTELLRNPLNAPYYLAVKGLSYLFADTLLVTRLVSAGVGLLTLVLFCWLVRQWHGPRTAMLATMLFGTSAIFLHASRLGTPEVLMFGLFLLVACGFWVKSRGNSLVLLLAFLLVAGLLYVPGMVWIILIGAFWQWRTLDRAFKEHLAIVSLGALLFLSALAPLAWAIYKDYDLVRPWLGVPEHLPTVLQAARDLLNLPIQFFIRHQTDPLRWLGTVAILDVFATTMFFLGGWRSMARIKRVRIQLLLAIFTLSTLLITIGGSVTLTILAPFVYIVIAAGINYLLTEWYAVFPRNPIAKGLGLGLLSIVVALACIYQLRHYFVGWPQANATESVFTVERAADRNQ